MSNVIDFNAARIKNQPHVSGEAVCIGCKHRWTAVRKHEPGVLQPWIECPSCGAIKGVFADALLHHTLKETLVCGCGCDAYMIARDESKDAFVSCINCGDIKGKVVC